MDLTEDNDAQFMLLAGFLIAIGLVITTVMLNSIIFEGNMAIESVTEHSKYGTIVLMQITTDEIRSAYRNATENGGSVENMTSNFTMQVNDFSEGMPKLYSMYGDGAKITYENWTNKGYANFTENGRPDGKDNWTVVEGVNAGYVDVFNFTINLIGSDFKIEVRNSTGSPVWSIEFNNTNKYNVTYVNDTYVINSTTGDFTYGSLINLTSASYYFNLIPSSSSPVSIHIVYGRNAFGTYKIVGELANSRNFTRERHYVLNTMVAYSTSKVKANISMPVTVPW